MPQPKPVRFKHFCNIGDAIAAMPALKRYHQITGKKGIFVQQIDVPGSYYPGATHPTKNDNGVEVMCNRQMFDMLKPLLASQPYIHDVEIYNGQPINVNLDVIRKEIFVNLPNQAIQQWVFMAYPDLATDLSKPWIEIGEVDISDCVMHFRNLITGYLPLDDLSGMAIINFTERYRNHHIDYFFLKRYKNKLLFAGTEKEHQIFCDTWGIEIPRLMVNNFLQLAYILKQVKFLLSNQSFLWNVSTAMGTPHVLELCEYAPNTQCFYAPFSFGFLHQAGVKYYVEQLMKK